MPDRRCECGAVWLEVARGAANEWLSTGKDRRHRGCNHRRGGKGWSSPVVHRRFDNRLAELPPQSQRRWLRRPCPGGSRGGGGGIQGGIDVLVFSRGVAFATGFGDGASLLAGLALLRPRCHLRLGFRQLRLGVQHRDAIGAAERKQYFPGF